MVKQDSKIIWKLQYLLQDIIAYDATFDCEVTGLALDSRKIKPGDIFFAYPGTATDGRKFIDNAIINGAVAIIAEQGFNFKKFPIPLIHTTDLQNKVGHIAARFYSSPSKTSISNSIIIGITGTNGKTTCSQLIARCLQESHMPCATIGTLGFGFPDQLSSFDLTTPDPILLQKQLSLFREQGVKAIAMEVSSHSLTQGRLAGTDFQIAIFTNLSRDHLDYHGDMENYWQAKRRLFTDFKIQTAIMNIDDQYGIRLQNDIKREVRQITYSLMNTKADIFTSNVELTNQGIKATVHTPWGKGIIHSCLLGRFNLSNLLAVIACLGSLEISLPEILMNITKMPRITGRMQAFGGDKQPLVVVDFSHTPDALAQALQALKEHCQGELWCVFGCGGNRDQGKRPQMAAIAERYADHIIITNDNPRHEDPEKIIQDIKTGLLCPQAVKVELDRRAAMTYAIQRAKAQDIILIAGKGHETYQQIGDKKIPFNYSNIF